MYDLLIEKGLLVNSREINNANIYIKDGKIARISQQTYTAKETYNAAGLYILPGCVDTHCHFREPGLTHKEDCSHGTRAAAIGGTTTVFDMPNTKPPMVNTTEFIAKANNFQSKAYVDYAFWGLCLGPLNNQDLQGLVDIGSIALKFFWNSGINTKTLQLINNYKPGMTDCRAPLDDGEVFELFEHVAKTGAILGIHAENNELIQALTQRIKTNEHYDYEALLTTHPNLAEVLAIQTALSLCNASGVKLHILHLSTAEGVELVRQAQKKKLPVTAETCPHYLFLNADDYQHIGTAMKVFPPVRRQKDQAALWAGLKEGVISLVCSDHAPHSLAEKNGNLLSVPAGSCGVETMLTLMLNEVNKGRITLPFVVNKLSENPAKLFHIYPQKGNLQPGADADIVLVDMKKSKQIRNDNLHSKQPLTPYDGMITTGWPVATFLKGIQIVEKGVIIKNEPTGKLLKPLK